MGNIVVRAFSRDLERCRGVSTVVQIFQEIRVGLNFNVLLLGNFEQFQGQLGIAIFTESLLLGATIVRVEAAGVVELGDG